MNEQTFSAGHLVEQIVDHGDGTGTRTLYHPETGAVTATETISCPLPEPVDPHQAAAEALAAMPPESVTAAVAAGALLVARAGDLWDALLDVADSNTAKPLLDQIVDVALTVALTQGEQK